MALKWLWLVLPSLYTSVFTPCMKICSNLYICSELSEFFKYPIFQPQKVMKGCLFQSLYSKAFFQINHILAKKKSEWKVVVKVETLIQGCQMCLSGFVVVFLHVHCSNFQYCACFLTRLQVVLKVVFSRHSQSMWWADLALFRKKVYRC